jgi:hypothetical protein
MHVTQREQPTSKQNVSAAHRRPPGGYETVYASPSRFSCRRLPHQKLTLKLVSNDLHAESVVAEQAAGSVVSVAGDLYMPWASWCDVDTHEQ